MTKKSRKDSFLGFHFDFHANARTTGIGTKTNAEEIGRLLDEVKPDYIQVDTKGHPGLASYFSQYAVVAPGLEVDHLKIFREETEKRGVALYAHHSGLWEKASCAEHPEWAVVQKDGTPSKDAIDPSGEYADQRLIPCLKKLADKYGFDGAWIDGDNWFMRLSWKKEAVEDFCKKTGYERIDEDPLSESYLAFVEYWKEKFTAYLRHYFQEVHKDFPDFEMTSNYAYSHFMPEKPIDEISFLSGDTVGVNGRITARSFAGLGKPWDTMSWGYVANYTSEDPSFFPTTNQNLERLLREAAISLSQGGGYQIVFNMTPQGEIRMYELDKMKAISRFVYDRKPFNFHSEPVKNAAILLSKYDTTRKRIRGGLTENPYSCMYLGVCDMILDGGLPCDIIYEHQILEPGRKTIILPEIEFLSEEVKRDLNAFTERGGNFIICGRKACRLFADMADADVRDYDGYMVHVEQDGNMFGRHDAVVFDKKGAVDMADCYCDAISLDSPKVSAVIANAYGKGKAVFVGLDIFTDYGAFCAFEEAEFMRRLLLEVDPDQAAYLEEGTKRVEIVPARKDGKLLVNLINTVEYVNGGAPNGIPKLYDLTIAVKCDAEPKKIFLEPEHVEAPYRYDGKYAHVKVDALHIHRILVVE